MSLLLMLESPSISGSRSFTVSPYQCQFDERVEVKRRHWTRVQGAARSVVAGVSEAHGRMHLLRASTWRRHGCASLAVAEACTFLASYSNDPEDTLHAYSQLALVTLDRQGEHSPFSLGQIKLFYMH
jgi:hypothetical protein